MSERFDTIVNAIGSENVRKLLCSAKYYGNELAAQVALETWDITMNEHNKTVKRIAQKNR